MKQSTEYWTVILLVTLPLSYLLSRYLPEKTAFLSGSQLYTPANYVYGSDSVFDDNILTYGTDYILAIIMFFLCLRIRTAKATPKTGLLQISSAFLIGSFSLSTFTGAICHHFLPYSINTWYWRLLWRICVGSVALAGGALGVCGSELVKHQKSTFFVPRIPPFFWVVYGVFYFGCVWFGFFSMRNPACDIFLTGVSQSLPTLYVGLVLLAREKTEKDFVIVHVLLGGLLSNIILLPGYDVLNYLQWRDSFCNVFLHTFLCISWSCQGVAFRHFVTE